MNLDNIAMLSFRRRLMLWWSMMMYVHMKIIYSEFHTTLANLLQLTKVFKFVYWHSDSYQGTALQDLTQHWITRITVLQHPSDHMKASRDTCRSMHQPHHWKNTEFYRLQELAMYRLHIVNSFSVMEIPNAVWPWELIWSPFKGLSSEFPALAFSYRLSQLFRVHLCRAAA